MEVETPLPPTLAYSDAATIGEAAAAALWLAESGSAEWVNAATGSSGTLQSRVAPGADEAAPCRGFDTIVTSFGGVHHYSGEVCRNGDGRSVLRIDPAGGESRS